MHSHFGSYLGFYMTEKGPSSQWSNPTCNCCLSYTVSTMSVDALATRGARASADMVLTNKPEYSVPSIRGVYFCHAEFIFNKHENLFAFSFNSLNLNDTGSWNPSSWKTRTHLSCIVSAMVADGLVMHEARASAAVVSTSISWIDLVSATDR